MYVVTFYCTFNLLHVIFWELLTWIIMHSFTLPSKYYTFLPPIILYFTVPSNMSKCYTQYWKAMLHHFTLPLKATHNIVSAVDSGYSVTSYCNILST